MIGKEIKIERDRILRARSDMLDKAIRDYDKNVYIPALQRLEEQCPHEDDNRIRDNGIGWWWTSCKWCGKRMREGAC